MDFLNGLGRFFGIKKETPLTESETRLLSQLQSNRNTALERIVPASDLIKSMFSDKQLYSIVRKSHRNRPIGEDYNKEFLKDIIYAYVAGIKGSGLRLTLNYGIDTEVIAKIMLQGID